MKPFIPTVFAVLALLAGSAAAEDLTVFAAASLTDALTEIGAAHDQASGDRTHFNFAASSTLARQIEAGAPADVFFSADEAQMDGLAARGLVAGEARKDLLGNSLVVVTAPDGPAVATLEDLAGPAVRRLSLGNPAAVPAGVYAKACLVELGLWEKLAPKVAPAENVRAALAVVESGNAEAAIVYKTDAAASRRVKVAFEIPASAAPRIAYPVAPVAGSRHAAAVGRFLAFLDGGEAREIFIRHGFVVLEPGE